MRIDLERHADVSWNLSLAGGIFDDDHDDDDDDKYKMAMLVVII